MSLKCLIKTLVVLVVAVMGLRLAFADPALQVEIVWDHDQPETVRYYNIYVSDTQGVPTVSPYARITRLPTDRRGVRLKLPATTVRYVTVTAVNAEGESNWSNQLKVDTSLVVTDLGVP